MAETLMGEFADIALEQALDHEEHRLDFRVGALNHLDAYELGIIDELGYELGTAPQLKTCRCCGTTGLHWSKLRGKWRLFADDGLHNCPANPLRE